MPSLWYSKRKKLNKPIEKWKLFVFRRVFEKKKKKNSDILKKISGLAITNFLGWTNAKWTREHPGRTSHHSGKGKNYFSCQKYCKENVLYRIQRQSAHIIIV
jgi:hypothetical protein